MLLNYNFRPMGFKENFSSLRWMAQEQFEEDQTSQKFQGEEVEFCLRPYTVTQTKKFEIN